MGRAGKLVCALAVLAASSAAPAQGAFPGENGRIALTRTYVPIPAQRDVMTVLPNGLGTMRVGSGQRPAWSADGTEIAFVDASGLVIASEDGSGRHTILSRPPDDIGHLAWSPAGDKLALALLTCEPTGGCFDEIWTIATDGTALTRLTFEPRDAGHPSWSPDGQRIVFDSQRGSSDLLTIRPDGTDLTNLTDTPAVTEWYPDWSPDGTRIGYLAPFGAGDFGPHSMPASGGPGQQIAATRALALAWSPDGARIAFATYPSPGPQRVWTVDVATGTDAREVASPSNLYLDADPAWQPVPQPPPPQPPLVGPGYPRPKGATPLHAGLVLAYDACAEPNRIHGPPLGFGSCSPPVRSSPTLTVGTADANGNPVRFAGYVAFHVLAGEPGRPEDSAVLLDVAMNDVRWNAGCPGPSPPCELEGYGGELEGVVSLRITDRLHTFGTNTTEAGTVTDASFSFPITCIDALPAPRCDLTTDVNAIVPGLVRERRRAIWELGAVRVLDAGPDGSLSTPEGQATFLRQGVFIP